MHSAFLLLGSNLGNRFELLDKARLLINNEAGRIIKCSSLYETEPWGLRSEYDSEIVYDFLNQVILINTLLAPTELLKSLKNIETALGRVKTIDASLSKQDSKKNKWQNRTIDIDILFYDDIKFKDMELTIPHPYIVDRKFVLKPLNEIAAEYIHPGLGKPISLLYEESSDKAEVKLYKEKGCN